MRLSKRRRQAQVNYRGPQGLRVSSTEDGEAGAEGQRVKNPTRRLRKISVWKKIWQGHSDYWVSVKTNVNVLCTFTGIPFNIVGLKTHLRAASIAAARNSG